MGLIKAAVVRVKKIAVKYLMKFEIDYQMSFDSLNSEVKDHYYFLYIFYFSQKNVHL